jgi:ADP-heptose:LPS heptosyltransferase
MPGTDQPRPRAFYRSSVRRIAVFRALMLGDLLCATPALRALRAGFPGAEISLVGLPWAAELAARLDSVDRHVEFPGFPGLPERVPDLAAVPVFLAAMQAERFDLAVQLHGSGQLVNPLVAAFGARHTAGFALQGDWCPEPALFAQWRDKGHEIVRLLALTDHLGLARQGLGLDFPLRPQEHAWVRALQLRQHGYVVLHPGAQLASRRWPVERFAAVAAALARRGWQVLVTGSAGETPLAQQIVQAAPVIDMTGRTTLWQLGALVKHGALVVANDTGISHVAAACSTPSVIISCGSDPLRWAPLDPARHRVLATDVACRPCAHRECPTLHECATGTTVDAVLSAIDAQLEPAHA